MNGSNRNHEAQAIGGSHLPATPIVNQRNPILRRNQARVGRRQCLIADVVLIDPGQAGSSQRRNVVALQGSSASIACLSDKNRTDADYKLRRP
jgi:hypothetical protein